MWDPETRIDRIQLINTYLKFNSSKFWDYGRNINLEEFDTQRVYRILMGQSVDVAAGLNKQKEDAKGKKSFGYLPSRDSSAISLKLLPLCHTSAKKNNETFGLSIRVYHQ